MTGFRNVVLRFAPLLLAAVSLVSAQQQQSRITPNFKDADITQIAEAVSAATQKTIIMDPRVRAQVTMYSSTPMYPRAFYEAVLSILQVYGFIAVPAGNIIKVMPDAVTVNGVPLIAVTIPLSCHPPNICWYQFS